MSQFKKSVQSLWSVSRSLMMLMGGLGLTISQHASAAPGELGTREYLDFENYAQVELRELPELLAPEANRKSLESLLKSGILSKRGSGNSNRGEARNSEAQDDQDENATATVPMRRSFNPAGAVVVEDDEEELPSTRSGSRPGAGGTRPLGNANNGNRGNAQREKEKELTPLEQTAEDVGTVEKIVDSVINIGKKVWGIVEAGEPVYTANYARANALPSNLQHWSEMSDWNPIPRSRIYQFEVKNLYGMKPVSFAYRISFIYGGKFDGTGAFLNDVGVESYNLSVLPMYSFDASAEVTSTSNIGTRKEAIAGMRLRVKMVVKTVVKHGEFTHEFFLRGDNGSILDLTNGN